MITKKEQRMVKGLKQLWRKHFTDKQYLAIVRSDWELAGYHGSKDVYYIHEKNGPRKIEWITKNEVLEIVGAIAV